MSPLTYGTLRAHLATRLRLASSVGRQLHGEHAEQYVALMEGRAVTFTASQLASFFPGGEEQHPALPAAYTAEAYVLSGDNTLTEAP
jgi:hypothetical protein